MIRQFSTASSACPSMEPQISSTSIDENRSLPYHATDPCQMNFSLQIFAKFCDSNILTQIFFKLLFADFATTLPELCVRIGKLVSASNAHGTEGMRVLVGVIRFSILPTFKAHAKPKKCHLFSGP